MIGNATAGDNKATTTDDIATVGHTKTWVESYPEVVLLAINELRGICDKNSYLLNELEAGYAQYMTDHKKLIAPQRSIQQAKRLLSLAQESLKSLLASGEALDRDRRLSDCRAVAFARHRGHWNTQHQANIDETQVPRIPSAIRVILGSNIW